MSALDDLLSHIFDGSHPDLYDEFAAWLRASRRFALFAAHYRDKIRTKLRNVRDEGGRIDLRTELHTAAVLLRDDQFTLEYESYAASKQRGPDFTVTFRTHTPFNIEVRRIRSLELAAADADARIAKVMSVLSDKVGQMPPGIVNLLWLSAGAELPDADLNRAMAILRHLAESKTAEYFTRRGFESPAHFLRQYRQLSGIVLPHPGTNYVWLNPLARHKTPPDIVRAIQRLTAP
ncbi:MAG: hypothetical protein IPK52_17245 [Chloroflexi bacterium]|nr:hypothetical protein [Chloroflexota bacterium]